MADRALPLLQAECVPSKATEAHLLRRAGRNMRPRRMAAGRATTEGKLLIELRNMTIS